MSEEEVQVYCAEQIARDCPNPQTKFVTYAAYKRLLRERRFIPVEELSPWICVQDRLPEEQGVYLIYAPSRDLVTTADFRNVGALGPPVWSFDYRSWPVTHWMPLPAPPQETP